MCYVTGVAAQPLHSHTPAARALRRHQEACQTFNLAWLCSEALPPAQESRDHQRRTRTQTGAIHFKNRGYTQKGQGLKYQKRLGVIRAAWGSYQKGTGVQGPKTGLHHKGACQIPNKDRGSIQKGAHIGTRSLPRLQCGETGPLRLLYTLHLVPDLSRSERTRCAGPARCARRDCSACCAGCSRARALHRCASQDHRETKVHVSPQPSDP
jgi:hypothetical protein